MSFNQGRVAAPTNTNMKGTQEQKKGNKTMSNQIKLNDGETLIGAVCENSFR